MGLFDDLVPAQPAGRAPVPDVGRALLDTIAGSESPGYDVMYGGGKFTDFTDHPRQAIPIASGPNVGKTSSAAGRYQFLGSTWDEVKKEAGLPDFSPESQDAGAWHLASKTYKTKTGRDLESDLTNAKGNPAAIQGIGKMLSGVWTSLPGGIEPNKATGSFAQRYDGGTAPHELSSQAKRTMGLFDDLVPVNPPSQATSPPESSPLLPPAGSGGQSDLDRPAAEWPLPGSPAAEIGRKLSAAWENPAPHGLISTVKPIVQGVKGLISAAGGDVPMTDESGRTNPEVIKSSFNAALGLTPAVGAPVPQALARVLSGAPRPGTPPAPALEANVAAQNIGVELPRAIGSDSQLTRFMGQVANRMPGGGPMQTRVGEAIKQTGEAVGTAAERAGGAADPMAAGQGFRAGIETSFKPTLKARVGEAYDQVTNLIDKDFTRPLEATQGAVADIIARRVASGESDPGKAINTVLGGVQRPGGLTYEGVKDLRTRVGEMLDTGIFPEGMSQHELRRIYSSLSDDLKATVAASGNDKALTAFNRANAMHKFGEEWKDNLGKVLGTDRSGEGITSAILRMASQGPTGDLKALTMARAAVPKQAWQDVATTAVSQLGKDRKGEFSPAIFLNDFAKLSDRGKTLLFNDVGAGNVLPHLKDIATVSKKFIEAGKLANTSGTAGHNATWAMLAAGATGLLHGSLIEPVTAITAVVGNNLMARALSRPASAAAIARWSRTYEALASNPSPRSIAAFNIASRNLANTINGQFGTNIQPGGFLKAIQAPATGRAEDNQ